MMLKFIAHKKHYDYMLNIQDSSYAYAPFGNHSGFY